VSAASPWVKIACFLDRRQLFYPRRWWQGTSSGRRGAFCWPIWLVVPEDCSRNEDTHRSILPQSLPLKAVQFCTQLAKNSARSDETSALANVFEMINIEHSPDLGQCNYVEVKIKKLTRKQVLSVPCPTCWVAIGQACRLSAGAPRTEPHRNRKLSVAEALQRSRIK